MVKNVINYKTYILLKTNNRLPNNETFQQYCEKISNYSYIGTASVKDRSNWDTLLRNAIRRL